MLRPDIAMTRRWRRSRLRTGALIIAVPSCAGALAASQALAAPAPDAVPTADASLMTLQDPVLTAYDTGATVPRPVRGPTQVRVRTRHINVLGGQPIQVSGRLLPGMAGRRVALQARQGRRWHTLARTQTRAAGRFVLRYVAGSAGRQSIRVSFAGDRLGGGSAATVGPMTVYRAAGASWYDDGGHTACGFHAYYGVANRTLPCGTRVSLRYNGRSVTATVDDRGPYVGGRDWDLNQNTASALGFGGVGAVWSSQ
jgi:rare lipoprotein A